MFILGRDSGLFFVEAMDMIRKLLLIGFLTLVEVGTTTQVVAGVILSFMFFAVHVKYMPFRHHEDNMLRATAEAHLFIVTIPGQMSDTNSDIFECPCICSATNTNAGAGYANGFNAQG